MVKANGLILRDGARVAIVGGGPAGSFFSIFASQLASDLSKKLDITIYERKTFINQGASGCNMCAGVVSESLVQLLAIEGINLPSSVVQRGIDSYYFHTKGDSVQIKSSRLQQRGVATIYRGGGPVGSQEKGIQSFDDFLLNKAVKCGARVKHIKVDGISLEGDKPRLYSRGKILQDCDLLVIASGVKAGTGKMYEELGIGYKVPSTLKAMQLEIELGEDWIASRFGGSIHMFLLRIPGVKFVSLIPKGDYITVSILGKEPDIEYVKTVLNHPVIKKMLPSGFKMPKRFCRCFPKINTGAARTPFANRVVFVGDSSSTRLYKDGIGSAYITSKAAAQTALLQGVGKEVFREHYLPVCKNLNMDNLFGQYLFFVNKIISVISPLSRSYFKMIQQEQINLQKDTPNSDIIWDMFTGSRFYKDIFIRTLSPLPIIQLLIGTVTSSLRIILFPHKRR
jgi:flavin-dependent dehydrogenase